MNRIIFNAFSFRLLHILDLILIMYAWIKHWNIPVYQYWNYKLIFQPAVNELFYFDLNFFLFGFSFFFLFLLEFVRSDLIQIVRKFSFSPENFKSCIYFNYILIALIFKCTVSRISNELNFLLIKWLDNFKIDSWNFSESLSVSGQLCHSNIP